MSNAYNEHAADLINGTIDLIEKVLIKHSAAVLNEMHDQIVSRNQEISRLRGELDEANNERLTGCSREALMKTSLPEIAVNISGDIGKKNWRHSDGRGCVTPDLTLDETREVARRANAYPELVHALHCFAIGKPYEKRASNLLRKLGEFE